MEERIYLEKVTDYKIMENLIKTMQNLGILSKKEVKEASKFYKEKYGIKPDSVF